MTRHAQSEKENLTIEWLLVLISDFVDALSAPLQFMSQAEKRAKQMQEMGIDEKDISDIPVVTATDAEASTNGNKDSTNKDKPATNATQNNNAGGPSVQFAEKKKEKGQGSLTQALHPVFHILILAKL